MRNSPWGIFCAGVLAAVLAPVPSWACNQPPPNPPVWIIPQGETPEGQLYWVIFHDYSTFGAGQGQFCACGLAIDDPSIQVLGVEVIDSATNQPLPGFSFSSDPNVAVSYGNAAPANWVGFLSPILATVPPGLSISLHFSVLVPAGIGFKRGDFNCDGCVTAADAVALQEFIFKGGPGPCCGDAADADDNGRIQLTDAVLILNFVSNIGPPPAAPGPLICGLDLTPDGLDLNPGCAYSQALCTVQCQGGGGAGLDPDTSRLMAALQRGMVGTGEGMADGALVPGHIHVVNGSSYGPIQVVDVPQVPALSPAALPVLGGLLAVAGAAALLARRRPAGAAR